MHSLVTCTSLVIVKSLLNPSCVHTYQCCLWIHIILWVISRRSALTVDDRPSPPLKKKPSHSVTHGFMLHVLMLCICPPSKILIQDKFNLWTACTKLKADSLVLDEAGGPYFEICFAWFHEDDNTAATTSKKRVHCGARAVLRGPVPLCPSHQSRCSTLTFSYLTLITTPKIAYYFSLIWIRKLWFHDFRWLAKVIFLVSGRTSMLSHIFSLPL